MTRSAAARADVSPFYVMEVMRAAAEREAAGHRVLHLEVGQPSTAAPPPVIAAAHQALESGMTTGKLVLTSAGDPGTRRPRG